MQIWPPVVDPATLTRQVWDSTTAQSLPAVGRAMALYGGLISQCDLDQYAGVQPTAPRPRILDLPDLELGSLALFTRVHVEDYLVHGNAIHLVTARDKRTGWPAAVKWFPAAEWSVDPSHGRGNLDYYLNGRKVARREDVVHVRWGAAPGEPFRGWGIVERYLKTLDRAGLQEAAETNALKHGSVPSVAVIAPQKNPDQADLDAAADRWEQKFGGSARRPVILPNGTEVTPLSFSPHDQEATLARQATLTDVANLLNLDPYWVGAPGSSHTYKSPGPMFLTLLRTSLEPVMKDLEQTWGWKWTEPQYRVKFDRQQLTRDDLQTTITTLRAAVEAGLMTVEEARVYLGWSPVPTLGTLREPKPAAAALPPAEDDQDQPGLTVIPGGQEGTG
jgi:HK97 family phage portal protein